MLKRVIQRLAPDDRLNRGLHRDFAEFLGGLVCGGIAYTALDQERFLIGFRGGLAGRH